MQIDVTGELQDVGVRDPLDQPISGYLCVELSGLPEAPHSFKVRGHRRKFGETSSRRGDAGEHHFRIILELIQGTTDLRGTRHHDDLGLFNPTRSTMIDQRWKRNAGGNPVSCNPDSITLLGVH